MNSEHTGCQHFIHTVGQDAFAVGCIAHSWVELTKTRGDAQSRQAAHEKAAMKMRHIQAAAKRSEEARPNRAAPICPICKINVPKGGHYHMAAEILGES